MLELSAKFQTSALDYLIQKKYPICLLIDSGTNMHIHSTQFVCSCPTIISPFIWKIIDNDHLTAPEYAIMRLRLFIIR